MYKSIDILAYVTIFLALTVIVLVFVCTVLISKLQDTKDIEKISEKNKTLSDYNSVS